MVACRFFFVRFWAKRRSFSQMRPNQWATFWSVRARMALRGFPELRPIGGVFSLAR